jgi:rod shape-determining protein MreC
MFSKRLLTTFCLILFAAVNIILLSISAKHRHGSSACDRVVMAGVAPFQEGVTQAARFCEHVWHHYFSLVTARQECDHLQQVLAKIRLEQSQQLESELACQRFRKLLLLDTETPLSQRLLPAQIVGLDPSIWFRTVIINKGVDDGVSKGMPVIAPEGIVGQIVAASYDYAKVLLLTDRSSAIDALVQRTRTRGIVEGEAKAYCQFKYVVRKAEISVGDTVVSSGLDGVFPKGLRVGSVTEIAKGPSGIFQEVSIRPFVDFERLEEVLVIVE